MSEIVLVVRGRRYGGWKSVSVTRSIESMAGKFDLGVSDRWGALTERVPIAEEDPCRVEIDGIVVIDGFVDTRRPSISATARSLSFSGRDRAAALVDCSLVLSKWTFRELTFVEFASTIVKPWSIKVSVQPGLVLEKRRKIVVQPGDRAYEVLAREAAEDGVLLVSDGAGGIVITRSGAGRATPLIEGSNILSADAPYDGTDRYHRYVITGQAPGTDEAFGEATQILAEAIDEGVRRTDRVLLIRAEKAYNVTDARRRADWEARIRAARSETVGISVRGWKQPTGPLWPLNALTYVEAPSIGVSGDMLISQAESAIDESGEITKLHLVRPDAFTPEPKAKVKRAEGAWKELAGGAR